LRREAPIGVFDSGVGGLTVARELMRQLPGERVVYFGDTARAPYGNKSPRALVRFALESARFLSKQGVKFLVVACNSSSAYSLPALRKHFKKLPLLGVIDAGAQAAIRASHGEKLGVIGTQATIRSGAYQNALHALSPSARPHLAACPLFVPLVEEGWLHSPVTRSVAQRYLLPLKRRGVKTLVLGCTHYPLLKPVIRRVMGSKVRLVDSARETARQVSIMLQETGLKAHRRAAAFHQHRFFVSDLPEQFTAVGQRFLGQPLRQVKQVVPAAWTGPLT